MISKIKSRMTDSEENYLLDALRNEFSTTKNNIYNNKFEKAFAERVGCKYAIGHVNGTATMHTALASLNVRPGDEVVVPPLTMTSTSLAVLHNGSIPVYADVDLKTFLLTADSIEKVITKKTKAIITVALYGLVPDYDSILNVCKKYNLFLIEDNAECFLGKYKGKIAGVFGDFASFSFQASKHLSCGEGGMLTCKNFDLANKARQFSTLGYAGVDATKGKIARNDIQDPNYSRHVAFGFNYRMSELQAAVGLGQLERAEELVGLRIRVAKLFDEIIKECDFLIPQFNPEDCENSYWTYAMYLKTDNPGIDWYKFRNLFQKNGGDGYYAAWKLSYNEPFFISTVQQMAGVWQKYNRDLCPNAEYLQKRMIQLKTNYWDFSEAEKQAEVLEKTIREYKKEI